MKETTGKFMEKAARSLAAAERLTNTGDAEFAVGRAYYAMFYVAVALLNEKGLRFRKHGGVHGAFGEHFAKTGLLDQKYHRWLLEAFSKRVTGDYGVDTDLNSDDARIVINQAQDFLQAAKEILTKGRL